MQHKFDFGEPEIWRPKNPERLFFGVLLKASTAWQVRRLTIGLADRNALTGKLVDMVRSHISLHHVGDFKRIPSWAIYAAERAGNAVSMTRFDVALPAVTSFRAFPRADCRPPRHPFVCLGAGAGLFKLHDILGRAMRDIGLRASDGVGFVPHVTLLYDRRLVQAQRIEPIRFTVDGFCLIHSWRGLSRYTVLRSWGLDG